MKLVKVFCIAGLVSLFAASTAFAQQAESIGDETDPVYLFNEMCYTQVPNVDQIQDMATQFGWSPMGGEDLEQFSALENPEILKGWDLLLEDRIYRLGLVQSAPAAAFVASFPTFEHGQSTSCTLIMDGRDSADVILERMNSLMRKAPISSDVPDGDLLATTWAGGNDDVIVFVLLKTDVSGSASLINVTIITRE